MRLILYMQCDFKRNSSAHHLDLSFSLGGWKLLLDINISALKHCFKCHRAGICLNCLHAVNKIQSRRPKRYVTQDSSVYLSALSSLNLSELDSLLSVLSHLIGWRSNMGGWSSASSMAVMPAAQISHRWLYPPFFSTAATSGAILHRGREAEET